MSESGHILLLSSDTPLLCFMIFILEQNVSNTFVFVTWLNHKFWNNVPKWPFKWATGPWFVDLIGTGAGKNWLPITFSFFRTAWLIIALYNLLQVPWLSNMLINPFLVHIIKLKIHSGCQDVRIMLLGNCLLQSLTKRLQEYYQRPQNYLVRVSRQLSD